MQSTQEVNIKEKRIYNIASKFGYVQFCACFVRAMYMYVVVNFSRGIPGGEENGRRGYLLTFSIAYIRVCKSLSVCMCVCVCVCVCVRVCV